MVLVMFSIRSSIQFDDLMMFVCKFSGCNAKASTIDTSLVPRNLKGLSTALMVGFVMTNVASMKVRLVVCLHQFVSSPPLCVLLRSCAPAELSDVELVMLCFLYIIQSIAYQESNIQ